MSRANRRSATPAVAGSGSPFALFVRMPPPPLHDNCSAFRSQPETYEKILAFAVPILVCLLLGYLAGLIQADSIREWYPTLRKPPLTPPNIVFPIAWGILYLCMGISAGLIYLSSAPQRDFLIRLFCVQLFSNFIWSYLFFYLRNPLLGMIDILTLDIFVIYYLIKSYPVSKTASVLFAPYALWVLFATYLNGYIMLTN